LIDINCRVTAYLDHFAYSLGGSADHATSGRASRLDCLLRGRGNLHAFLPQGNPTNLSLL